MSIKHTTVRRNEFQASCGNTTCTAWLVLGGDHSLLRLGQGRIIYRHVRGKSSHSIFVEDRPSFPASPPVKLMQGLGRDCPCGRDLSSDPAAPDRELVPISRDGFASLMVRLVISPHGKVLPVEHLFTVACIGCYLLVLVIVLVLKDRRFLISSRTDGLAILAKMLASTADDS